MDARKLTLARGNARLRYARLAALRLLAPAAVAALVVIAVGCGSAESPSSDATLPKTKPRESTTTVTAAPDPTAKIEAEVRLAYEDWRRRGPALFVDPDPNDPVVDELFAAGPLRDGVRANLQKSRDAKITADPDPGPLTRWHIERLEVVSASEALVEDCYVDGGVTRSSESGEVINDDVTTYQARLTFIISDGRWKASAAEALTEVGGEGQCVEQE